MGKECRKCMRYFEGLSINAHEFNTTGREDWLRGTLSSIESLHTSKCIGDKTYDLALKEIEDARATKWFFSPEVLEEVAKTCQLEMEE